MHRDYLAPGQLDGVKRALSSKQFVSDRHDDGFTRDETTEAFCQMFGVSPKAARLFVDSHPVWAAEAAVEKSSAVKTFTT